MAVIQDDPRTAGRIVVGYDATAGAVGALEYAAKLAAQRGAELLVVMALPHLSPTSTRTQRALKVDPDYLVHIKTRANRKLDAVTEDLSQRYPALGFETVIVAQDAAGVLADASQDAALVVVGARGRTSDSRVPVLGGVSDAVITHASGPVMVVPEGIHDTNNGPVVVGMQDAPDAIAACKIAIQEAAARKVPLVALYAWDVAPELGEFAVLARYNPEQTCKELDAMLAELLTPLLAEYPEVKAERRVVQGSAKAALVDASATASLIAMGSRGLGGFAGLLLGSVSRAVTRESECPVVVARAPQQ